ncbi:restriction endonuclease subunit S [Flavobacterium hiemivividum]|uniref:Restriction endonuclease subunit S n=1 Tax=Flavobacterium hiemivividum TaxID=2541734 RepID=A0A4R5D580_9FLAO|nr:restriction endonuclease subunit S [Flavobacterium hiemivividum]TDE06741.1 restriction endonuclease subunit S [Flavobacterium hiemivividum]
MENIKPYTKYKSSGISWLGDVPEHWSIKRIKYVFKEQDKRSEIGLEDLLSVSHYTGVTRKSDKVMNGDFMTNAKTLVGYKIVEKGDLVINIMLAWNGSLGISKFDGITSPAYCVYKSLIGGEKYFGYLFRTKNAQQEFKKQSTGIIDSRLRLYTDKFFNIKTVIPSLEEQTAIAKFLDYKTAKIDRFIRKKKQLIKLLNEQKAGIINHAVTKGLDPIATMKDSSIEWLGNIPEHWGVKPLRNLVSLNDETLSEKTSPDYEIRYIDIGNVNSDGVVAEIVNYKFKDAPSRAKRIVKNGDVIISTVRTYLKAITQIKNDTDNLIVSTGFAVLRPRKLIISDFLNFAVRSNYFIETICSNSYGVSYPAINASQIMHFKIALPTENEQTEIVAYIEKETSQLNQLIQTIEKEIALTQEYRTALIAEAVTGKIDVRAFVIPTVSQQEELYEEIEEELDMVAEDTESYENE